MRWNVFLRRDGGNQDLVFIANGFGVAQLIIHLWEVILVLTPRLVAMHSIAYFFDLFLLFIYIKLIRLFEKLGRGKWNKWLNFGAKIFLIIGCVSLFLYPSLLAEFLAFPINIFETGAGITWFSLKNLVSTRLVIAVLIGSIFIYVFLRFKILLSFRFEKIFYYFVFSVCFLVLLLSGWNEDFLSTIPHPLIYSIKVTVERWSSGSPRVVPPPEWPISYGQIAIVERPGSPFDTVTSFRYNHILIFVMETVNKSRFIKEFERKENGFYARVKDRMVTFENYYSTNLDSYTSLIAMLTSIQVPYRAYEAPYYFAGINQAPNMVDALGNKSWRSMFVCTAEFIPFVPVPKSWDVILHAPDLPKRDQWVSIGLNPVEAAIEDKAAIESILSFTKNDKYTIVLHEMVFGHSPRWEIKLKKTQLEYYDEFFLELYGRLEQLSLLDKTLLVILADHGERGNSTETDNYHVPLLVIGEGIEPSSNYGMFSHVDLQQIVAHFLSDLPMPGGRDEVLIIGSSARWVYGMICNDGNSLFLDALDGIVLHQRGVLSPFYVYEHFQAQINSLSVYLQK